MITRIIQQLLWGKAKKGMPVADISMGCHTTYPDTVVHPSKMHIVIFNELEKVRKKLAEVS